MAGTSADGVDACLAAFRGRGARLSWHVVAHHFTPYPAALRRRVLSAAGPTGTVEEACRLNMDLGRLLGRAAVAVARSGSVPLERVALVASHGQTLRHLPPVARRGGATLQLGEAAVIAESTGLPVVADFRTADVAAGGHGAPLVPVADALLFADADSVVALQNIGGMANVTLLPPRAAGKPPLAFDTGPGNVLSDLAAARASAGRERFDRGGRRAARGRVVVEALDWLMQHPYLRRRPPKSTGREEFGEVLFARLLALPCLARATGDDVVATVTAFTARSIASALIPLAPDRVLVAGGGARNGTLLQWLARDLAPLPVEVLGGRPGVLSDQREALCFALLGDLFLAGTAGAEPAVTGARHRAILGKLSLPPGWVVSS